MYALLNLFVFVLLTGYSFKLIISKPSYVKLSKTEKVRLSGQERFLLLTMVTGMISVGGVSIGLQLSALRLMIWMMMIVFAFIIFKKPIRFNLLVLTSLLFLGWMIASLIWSKNMGFGIRVILKYLYPILIMLFAFTFVRSKAFIFISMRWMIITAFVLSIFLGGFTTGVLHLSGFYLGGVFWPMATLAGYLSVMSGVSYLMWWRTKESKYLYLIGWFLLSSIFASIRTGVLGIFIVLMAASYLRYKVVSLAYIGGIVFLALASAVFVPQIREKMFYDSSAVTNIGDLQKVDASQIDSSGRFAMWEWSLNNYYVNNKMIGSGIGAIQEIFYSGNHPFGRIKIIHNDYVQILCDNGLIGLFLYLFFVVISGYTAMKYMRNKVPKYLSNVSFLVITSFTGTMSTMMTDNVVNYAFAVHSYPFIFVGIMMASRNIYKRDKNNTSRNFS